MMYKNHVPHLHVRDGVYYFVRRVPIDVRQYYASNRISFSLKSKSFAMAHRASKSIVQRLDDLARVKAAGYGYTCQICFEGREC